MARFTNRAGPTAGWLNNFPWKDVEDLPYAPPWVLEELQAKWEAQEDLPAVPDDFKEVELRTGLIKGTLEDWWNGTVSALHADGTVDRSLTLWNIGLLLARQGVTFEEIVSALRDRDIALDFQKFHDRRDGGDTEYLRIAQKVLAGVQSHGLPTDTPMEWDQVVDAVAYDVASEPFYMEGADSPRRRFPLHTDRGAIRHIRQRLNPIWMETQQKIGHQGVHDRAVKCGDLPARGCDDCSTSFSDGKQYRYNCRARLHPLCMGTQARKPLWAMQEALETESNLEILIANLGVYDVGEDSFLWADKIRDISKQAHSWVRRLTSHKDCPESISTSFTAFRYDLHQRYLNLDLVILAPVVPDTATTLAASFGEATERAVTFKTVRVKSAEEAIGVYGNLLSSAVIYDDTAGCQAFLQGLKDVHMVQGRGRFRTKRATKPETDGLTNISNIVPSVDILEINANQAKPGGGKPLTRCPECGSSHTRYKGRIAGDWRKVKGPTGIWYWRLENVVEEGPDG